MHRILRHPFEALAQVVRGPKIPLLHTAPPKGCSGQRPASSDVPSADLLAPKTHRPRAATGLCGVEKAPSTEAVVSGTRLTPGECAEDMERFRKAKRILIGGSTPIDGDSVGNVLAAARFLKLWFPEKDIQVCLSGELRQAFRALDTQHLIKQPEEIANGDFDLVWLLDGSSKNHFSAMSELIARAQEILNYDHHEPEDLGVDPKNVTRRTDPSRGSACEIVAELVRTIGFPEGTTQAQRAEVALPLAVGIYTDTHGFKKSEPTGRSRDAYQYLVQEHLMGDQAIVPKTIASRVSTAAMGLLQFPPSLSDCLSSDPGFQAQYEAAGRPRTEVEVERIVDQNWQVISISQELFSLALEAGKRELKDPRLNRDDLLGWVMDWYENLGFSECSVLLLEMPTKVEMVPLVEDLMDATRQLCRAQGDDIDARALAQEVPLAWLIDRATERVVDDPSPEANRILEALFELYRQLYPRDDGAVDARLKGSQRPSKFAQALTDAMLSVEDLPRLDGLIHEVAARSAEDLDNTPKILLAVLLEIRAWLEQEDGPLSASARWKRARPFTKPGNPTFTLSGQGIFERGVRISCRSALTCRAIEMVEPFGGGGHARIAGVSRPLSQRRVSQIAKEMAASSNIAGRIAEGLDARVQSASQTRSLELGKEAPWLFGEQIPGTLAAVRDLLSAWMHGRFAPLMEEALTHLPGRLLPDGSKPRRPTLWQATPRRPSGRHGAPR